MTDLTTPEPRVRVASASPNYPGCYQWICEGCGRLSSLVYPVPDGRVQTHAHRHAATCPALRLARKECQWSEFVRELKALRDYLHTSPDEDWYSSDPLLAKAFNIGRAYGRLGAATDLTALIDRATDGGTG